MNHVVLLGDSICHNAAYVAGGPDVAKQVRNLLPSGWQVTLGAVDGRVTSPSTATAAFLPKMQLSTQIRDVTNLAN
jgi:hypothetical protein